ncbi:hypothetical protein QBC46DRAFT_380112, partial [Diplogelasinospora grovesii]
MMGTCDLFLISWEIFFPLLQLPGYVHGGYRRPRFVPIRMMCFLMAKASFFFSLILSVYITSERRALD